MGHDWIIDVLKDLRAFACENEMALLVEQLDEAVLAATMEAANTQAANSNWTMNSRRLLEMRGNKDGH